MNILDTINRLAADIDDIKSQNLAQAEITANQVSEQTENLALIHAQLDKQRELSLLHGEAIAVLKGEIELLKRHLMGAASH